MSGPSKQDADVIEFLEEAEAYFDRYSDVVDGPYGEPKANLEMNILARVKDLLSRMGDA